MGRAERDNLENVKRDRLNESQSRSLAVVLRSIEETVDSIEASLDQEVAEHILYCVINPYTPEEQREMRQVIAHLREVLRRCRDRWGLAREVQRLDVEVSSSSSIFWANLEDRRPEKMRRYGEVPKAVWADLDHDVEDLIGLVVRLGDVHRGQRRSDKKMEAGG